MKRVDTQQADKNMNAAMFEHCVHVDLPEAGVKMQEIHALKTRTRTR